MKTLFLAIAMAAFCCTNSFSQNSSFQKLERPDPTKEEWFGFSTGIEGKTAVIGASNYDLPKDGDVLIAVGRAFVFEEDQNGKWRQSQVLSNPAAKADDYFGRSISLSGEYLAIGCPGCDIGVETSDGFHREGAVFLYKRDKSNSWKHIQTLTLESIAKKNSQFGIRVSLHSDHLLVSSDKYKKKSQTGRGAVFMYERSKEGKWQLTQEILSPGNEKDFGNEIDLFEDYFAVASEASNVVHGYKKGRDNRWQHDFMLERTDDQDKGFGSSVSVTKDFLFVGSFGEGDYCFHEYDELPKTDSVYIKSIMDEATFSMTDKLFPNDKAVLESNGISREEFKSNAVLVESWEEREERKAGAGAVHVYTRNKNGGWKFFQKLIASDRGADDHFGMCLSSKGDLLVVGAIGDKSEGVDPKDGMYEGAAYIFKLNKKGKWEEIQKLQSTHKKNPLKFGFSVCTDAEKAIIGSRYEDDKGSIDAGAAYIWERK